MVPVNVSLTTVGSTTGAVGLELPQPAAAAIRKGKKAPRNPRRTMACL